MLPNKKLIEGNYKETYKKQHQSKYISSDPEVKDRFNIFKVNPIFKYDDKKHFQGLYNFDMNTFNARITFDLIADAYSQSMLLGNSKLGKNKIYSQFLMTK